MTIVFAFLVLLAFIVNTCKCVFMSYMDAVFISLERSLFHPHTLFTYSYGYVHVLLVIQFPVQFHEVASSS